MRRFSIVVPLLLLIAVSSVGCRKLIDWLNARVPTVYDLTLSVPYYAQEGHGSGAAVTKMWQEFFSGSSASQEEIWNFMQANLYVGYSGDEITSGTLTYALCHFGDQQAHQELYSVDETYENGRSSRDQAIADMKAALYDQHKPVVAQMYLTKYAIAKDLGFHLQSNETGYQACADYFKLHMPWVGADIYKTVGDMQQDLVSLGDGSTLLFFSSGTTKRTVGASEWAEFDETAGTYYGDPYPPEPACPPYCGDPGEDPPPMEEGMRVGGTAAPSSSAAPRTRLGLAGIPFVNPKRAEQVVADFVAGIRTTRLNLQPGFESLTMEDGRLKVAVVVRVRSLSDRRDYFLLFVIDAATGIPYVRATVDSVGWLGAVIKETGTLPGVDSEVAASILRSRHHFKPVRIEAVFAYGDLCWTEFQPLYLATDADLRQVYVAPDGRVFEERGGSRSGRTGSGHAIIYGKGRRPIQLSAIVGDGGVQ